MLEALRSKTGGIIAKIFIGVLALSFAVWGISDVFRGTRNDVLATVGDTEITVPQYQEAFRNALNRLSQQLNKPLTPDEARTLGLDRQVLRQLLQNAALDQEMQRLKLDVSDTFVAERIMKLDIFKGADGRFDRALFNSMLARAGLSEQQFVAEEKRGILRAALMDPVIDGLAAPQSLVKVMHEHRNAARDVQYFIVRPEGITVPEPTEEQLKAYYESHKDQFAVPERRKLAVLAVLPKDLLEKVSVPEEDIRDFYNRHKEEFGAPETRTVEQIAYASEDEARAARKKLEDGKATWEDLVKEKGLQLKDVKLGTFTKKTFPDPKIADAVFSLKKGAVSQPLKGTLSISLVRVTDIVPGHIKSFEEARNEIEKRLKLEKAKDKAYEIHDQIEDRRASGQSLDDIAKELGLKIVITPFISAAGTDEQDKPVSLPAAARLLKEAFASDIGVDNDVIATDDDGFVWFDVRDIRPASVKPFEKVKDEVAALWKKEQLRKAVMKKAKALAERARKGEDLANLAREVGAEVRTITGLKRNDARADFPVAATRAVFSGPEKGIFTAPGADGTSALVIRAIPLAVPPLDSKSNEAKAITSVLSSSLIEDTQGEFIAALQKLFGIKVNQNQWARIMGTQAQ